MPDKITPGEPGFPPKPDASVIYDDFITNLQAIEANTRALTTLIPKQTEILNQRLLDIYKRAGQPSRSTASPESKSGLRSGSSSLDSGPFTGGARELGQNWQSRATLHPSDTSWVNFLHLPGAHPTAVDYFDMMSISSANLAQKSQGRSDTRAQQAAYEALKAHYGGKEDQIPQYRIDALSDITGPEGRLSSTLGGASNAFASARSGYVTGKTISSMFQDITRPAHNARMLGYQMGYQGAGLTRTPFGIGGQLDLGAIGAGLGQRASQFGFAANEGITPGQSSTIYNNLAGLGWMGGPSTNNMRVAAAQMARSNPYIAQMPQYFEMMDKSTRMGAASLTEFNSAMGQVADASKNANVSLGQTMATMDALGQANKQQGGTYQGGLNNAIAWQNTTGLPATVMQNMMQSPLVQGQTFMQTGLMPWEQGLASPYQRMGGIMGGLNLMNRMVNTPGAKTTQDAIGLSSTISGQDQKEALISHFFPGVDKATIHAMLTNAKGFQAGTSIGQSATDYENRASYYRDNNGSRTAAWNDLQGKPWQTMQAQLSSAVDSQGHKMFEDWGQFDSLKDKFKGQGVPDSKLHQIAQGTARTNIQHAGERQALKDMGVSTAGMNADQIDRMVQGLGGRHELSTKAMADIAKARHGEITKYQKENTKKFGPTSGNGQGPQLTIELGPAAKKMFHLSDPNNQQKAANGAGAATVDQNSWGPGSPSAAPSPNLDTASGVSSYANGLRGGFGAAPTTSELTGGGGAGG